CVARHSAGRPGGAGRSVAMRYRYLATIADEPSRNVRGRQAGRVGATLGICHDRGGIARYVPRAGERGTGRIAAGKRGLKMDAFHAAVVDIRQAKLDVAAAVDFVDDPRFGGIATFVGRVREHNLGREVVGITYDLFEPLALRIFKTIGEQALADVGDPLRLYIAHAR